MINYDRNLFAVLIIYLMRIASINCQQYQQHMDSSTLRPFWKFSSYSQGNVNYQCYQKCIPTISTQPAIMIELCNKICPFKPSIPECVKCPQIYSQITQPIPKGEFVNRALVTQPESIVVEPKTHVIFFKPEIVVVGREQKQCCYLDQCETVPTTAKCESRCYEPCDAVCTGRCLVNPQCPNQCEVIRQEQYKMRYKIWLAQKLNEIKKKYRAMATACLLRTRLAFVHEIQNLNESAHTVLVKDEVTTQQQQQMNSNVESQTQELSNENKVYQMQGQQGQHQMNHNGFSQMHSQQQMASDNIPQMQQDESEDYPVNDYSDDELE